MSNLNTHTRTISCVQIRRCGKMFLFSPALIPQQNRRFGHDLPAQRSVTLNRTTCAVTVVASAFEKPGDAIGAAGNKWESNPC